MNAELVLEYIQTLVYPTLIAAVLAGAFLLYRAEIRHFLTNLREASFGGAAVRSDPPPPQPTTLIEATEPVAVPLESKGEADAGAALKGDYLELLIRYANAREELGFEKAYRGIYGTQLRCLQLLEVERQKGEDGHAWTREEIRGLHALHESKTDHPITFEVWLRFLSEVTGFVEEDENGRYRLSDEGHAFLLYLHHQWILADRPY